MPVVIALPELLAICGLVLALAMVTMGDQFTKALFQVTEAGVGWIPWLGKKAQNGVRAVQHRVNAVFSAAAINLEGSIAASWHVLASLIEETGQAIFEATQLAARGLYYWEVQLPLRLAKMLGQAAHNAGGQARAALRPVVKNYYTTTGISRAQFGRLARRLRAVEARMAAVPLIGAGAIALPFPRIGSLERRARAQAHRLSKVERKLGAVTFAGLVAGALARLGLGFMRCRNIRRTGRSVCGMDTDLLESLLGGALLLTSAISLSQLAHELQEPTELVTDAMHRLVREF